MPSTEIKVAAPTGQTVRIIIEDQRQYRYSTRDICAGLEIDPRSCSAESVSTAELVTLEQAVTLSTMTRSARGLEFARWLSREAKFGRLK